MNLAQRIAQEINTVRGEVGALTKTDVDLGNVDNTSDLNKPISTATQLALNAKENVWISETISTNTSAVEDTQYWVDTSTNSVTITLPTAPTVNTKVRVTDVNGTFSTNNCIIASPDHTIMGLNENLNMDLDYVSAILTFSGTDWRFV